MTRPVVFFEIHGNDGSRLREFYREMFGWKMDLLGDYAMVAPGIGGPEPGVGGGITSSPEGPRVLIYVQVANLEESLAKAESLGGKRIMPPFDVPNGPTIARCADPEGNYVGLVQQ